MKKNPYIKASDKRLYDRDGDVWLVVPGGPFLEDPESGERYTRSYVEQKFGPLKESKSNPYISAEELARCRGESDRGRLQPLRRVNPMKQPTIFMRQDKKGKLWRHYIIVTDGKDTSIELEPAMMGGWHVMRIESREGEDAWPDMSQADITAWMEHNRDDKKIMDPSEKENVLAMLAKYGDPYKRSRERNPMTGPAAGPRGREHTHRYQNPARALEPAIIEGVAQALFVPAWADYQDEIGGEDPGPGGDWMDIAPDTPLEAMEAAREFLAVLDRENEASAITLLMRAARADGVSGDDLDDEYAEDFGYYITMPALGYGVHWFDDHEDFDIEIPNIEAHYDEDYLSVSI